jgi:hypothetical protein
MTGWSAKIRELATEKYVTASKEEGQCRFTIRVADVLGDLRGTGFPMGNTPQVCNALRSEKFLKTNGLEIERTEGPKSLTSTTVVFHYRFKDANRPRLDRECDLSQDSRWLAFQRLKGSLKEVFAAHGGGEAFLKSLRSENEPQADRIHG